MAKTKAETTKTKTTTAKTKVETAKVKSEKSTKPAKLEDQIPSTQTIWEEHRDALDNVIAFISSDKNREKYTLWLVKDGIVSKSETANSPRKLYPLIYDT